MLLWLNHTALSYSGRIPGGKVGGSALGRFCFMVDRVGRRGAARSTGGAPRRDLVRYSRRTNFGAIGEIFGAQIPAKLGQYRPTSGQLWSNLDQTIWTRSGQSATTFVHLFADLEILGQRRPNLVERSPKMAHVGNNWSRPTLGRTPASGTAVARFGVNTLRNFKFRHGRQG